MRYYIQNGEEKKKEKEEKDWPPRIMDNCPSEITARKTKAKEVHHHYSCLTENAERSSSSWKYRMLVSNMKTYKVYNTLVNVTIQSISEYSNTVI